MFNDIGCELVNVPDARRGQFKQVAVRVSKIEASPAPFPTDVVQHLNSLAKKISICFF